MDRKFGELVAKEQQTRLVETFKQPATLADVTTMVVALSSVPDMGDGMNIWMMRKTDDKQGYFTKASQFPDITVTDPGAAFMFIENLQTERENMMSSAYSSSIGAFADKTITRSPQMDLLIGKITTAFSSDTLNVTSNINLTIEQTVVLPNTTAIALATLTSYWKGMVVTGAGQVPELDFYPWLPTFDSDAFSGGGDVTRLQNYIYRPALLPCTKQIQSSDDSVIAQELTLNQTKQIKMTLTTSNTDLRTDVRLATGTSPDMVNVQKELLAYKANQAASQISK